MIALKNGRIILEGGIREGCIRFDRQIAEICDAPREGDTVMDAEGLFVSPGFVDVHIHGYLGEDASDGKAEGLQKMAEGLIKNGVTSFLPTTMTVPKDELYTAFEVIRQAMTASRDWQGAEVLGCHAEGPCINPKKKGAQSEKAILPPDAELYRPYSDTVRLVTMAPEMQGAAAAARMLRQMGIRVSIGHTDADYGTCTELLACGADHFTHLFNAMSPLNHRDPGTAGAGLTTDAFTELIADTFHVDKALFGMLHKLKGDKLILITDCTRAGGLPDGEYTLGGQPIYVKGIQCRLKDGTIAGSVLKMNEAVRNFHKASGCSLHKAVLAATLAPAASVGMADTKGSLAAGKDADIILFDRDINIKHAFRYGIQRF